MRGEYTGGSHTPIIFLECQMWSLLPLPVLPATLPTPDPPKTTGLSDSSCPGPQFSFRFLSTQFCPLQLQLLAHLPCLLCLLNPKSKPSSLPTSIALHLASFSPSWPPSMPLSLISPLLTHPPLSSWRDPFKWQMETIHMPLLP